MLADDPESFPYNPPTWSYTTWVKAQNENGEWFWMPEEEWR